MIRHFAVMAVVMVAAGTARAQDVLTPTDVLEAFEVAGTIRAQGSMGRGTLENTAIDIDVKLQSLQFLLDGGVGLGGGIEVEFELPTQPWGDLDGDGTFGAADAELQQHSVGFGDLTLRGNYRLLKDSVASPTLLFGVVAIVPTGNDKRGQSEVVIGGVTVQDDEDGAIGEGVWDYGVSAGLAKSLGGMELYAIGQYTLGGGLRRTVGGARGEANALMPRVQKLLEEAEGATFTICRLPNWKLPKPSALIPAT